jgi:hypothetical protein
MLARLGGYHEEPMCMREGYQKSFIMVEYLFREYLDCAWVASLQLFLKANIML